MVDITAQQEAKEALRQSEERLRTILQTTQEGFVLLSEDGRFLDANDAYVQMSGYDRDELLALNIVDVDAAHGLAEVLARAQKVLAVGGEVFETRHRRKDGSVFDVSVAVGSMREGDRILYFAFVRDVTELRRAGEALVSSERRYRSLVEDAPVVIYTRDLENADVQPYVSPIIEQILGWPVSCWRDPEFHKTILHSEDREGVIAASARTKTAGESFAGEYRFLAKDGRTVWFFDQASVIRDRDGRPLMMQGVMVDITERKQAQEALLASEKRFREVLDNLQMLAVLLDADGHIQYANPFLLDLVGWSWEQVAGQDWFDLVVPEAVAANLRRGLFEAAIADRHVTTSAEDEIVTRDGQRRLIRWSSTVLRDPAGKPVGTASIGEDVTERRRLEEQLRQSQKMEMVGRLAGGVAHDFNNLLTTITGYSEFVQESLSPASAAFHDVTEVLRAAERASDLIRQLLAFSRRQVIQPRIVDLNDLVLGLHKMLRRLIGESIELVALPDEALWPVLVDPGQVEQVLVNLAVNARDAMPCGGTLTIETANSFIDPNLAQAYPDVEPGDYVTLTVSDTGEGMSEEVQAHLFEPFFTTKEAGRGTGLGLSTVYGIVKQHGGHITVDSAPGSGSRFCVYLPRAVSDSGSAVARPHRQALQMGDEAVLIVEDEASVRRVMARVLTSAGYRVLEASTPTEALALSGQHPRVDLLLTDVVMPQMSGKALADRLRADRPDLKVLFVSGYPQDELGDGGALATGVAFMHKPFTATALAAKARAVLDSGSG